MAAFNFFNSFIERMAEKQFDLGGDTLKVYLTNSTPSASADQVKADLTEISAGNGYTGPLVVAQSSAQMSGAIYKLVLGDPATITAAGGTVGPFQYVVLYDDTQTSDALIGWWNYGTALTLQSGETFDTDLSATNGVLQITTA